MNSHCSLFYYAYGYWAWSCGVMSHVMTPCTLVSALQRVTRTLCLHLLCLTMWYIPYCLHFYKFSLQSISVCIWLLRFSSGLLSCEFVTFPYPREWSWPAQHCYPLNSRDSVWLGTYAYPVRNISLCRCMTFFPLVAMCFVFRSWQAWSQIYVQP